MPGRTSPGDTGIGSEACSIIVDGEELLITQSYDIRRGVFEQPSSFSVRLGSGNVASSLLSRYRPGLKCQLKINGALQLTGVIDTHAVPSSSVTEIELQGRDVLRYLTDAKVEKDQSFKHKTYYELTRAVMDICGMKDTSLVAGNAANRQSTTKVAIPAVTGEAQPAKRETNICAVPASNPPPKMEYPALRAKAGEGSWYEWLCKQYKPAGLYLWATGDGSLMLGTPTISDTPAFLLSRRRGASRDQINVLEHSYRNSAVGRFAHYRLETRYTSACERPRTIVATVDDQEMLGWGFNTTSVVTDKHARTSKQAVYSVNKVCSQNRRRAFTLEYTIAGSVLPSMINPSEMGVPGVDCMVKVDDDELDIHDLFYVSAVQLQRGDRTVSILTMDRSADIKYLADKSV